MLISFSPINLSLKVSALSEETLLAPVPFDIFSATRTAVALFIFSLPVSFYFSLELNIDRRTPNSFMSLIFLSVRVRERRDLW